MRIFWKAFLGSLLALVVFSLIVFFLLAGIVGGLARKSVPRIAQNSVLVIDLSQSYRERAKDNVLTAISGSDELDVPGLYDVLRLIDEAARDERIAGIYLKANGNGNGLAASSEIREALAAFRESRKFIVAYADRLSQRAYYVASRADDIYVNPEGAFDWAGFSVDYTFYKKALDKLGVEPQVFYAGKFKSATEPYRYEKMSDENRLQTSVWLEELYGRFIREIGDSRNLDTALLRQWANQGEITDPLVARDKNLIDAAIYDDQVKDSLKSRLNIGKYDQIEFVSINKYFQASNGRAGKGGKIALIIAEGDIVDGKGDEESIGGERYQQLIRNARLDQDVKAIVLRVNSGGGSTLASELIWREMVLAQEEKPVIVSFGDVAASGGYYISCPADSIFANPMTLTGSIGVFGIIPNLEGFMEDKLGITFDGVKTGPRADLPTVTRAMTDSEKAARQREVEQIYRQFKEKVATGRKMDTASVENIAQGRVWSGAEAIRIGLIDRFGGLQDAIDAAASKAGLVEYRIREYPEPSSWLEQLLDKTPTTTLEEKLEAELGKEQMAVYKDLIRIQKWTKSPQARLPFSFRIE